MRYITKTNIIFVAILSVVVIFSCEEKEAYKSIPIVETHGVWYISQRTAKSGGNVIIDGGSQILARGVCWNTSSEPTINNKHTTESGGTGVFTSTLNGLIPATLYYVRAYATNKYGTGYGNEVTFESGPIQTAEVSTDPISSITSTSAVSGGSIGYNGGDSVTAKGICWSTSNDPTLSNPHTMDGSGNDHFISQLTGLSGNTTYYVRAFAINSVGIAYGGEKSFTTYSDSAAIVLFNSILFNPNLTYGTVTDADWNEYKTIQIGTQTWMAENLKTTTFISGEQIANVGDNIIWADYMEDAYCWYENDIAFKTNYGAFYNWYAVNSGKLCPVGWHVPSSEEFETLITFLGGESVAGEKLKESGTDHWQPPNTDADNESGFSALPGGYISSGEFMSLRTAGYWWSSTESNSSDASFMVIPSNDDSVSTDTAAKTTGMSVRCIKD
jgi:uncharacterized protein (TIGR02145 family)